MTTVSSTLAGWLVVALCVVPAALFALGWGVARLLGRRGGGSDQNGDGDEADPRGHHTAPEQGAPAPLSERLP